MQSHLLQVWSLSKFNLKKNCFNKSNQWSKPWSPPCNFQDYDSVPCPLWCLFLLDNVTLVLFWTSDSFSSSSCCLLYVCSFCVLCWCWCLFSSCLWMCLCFCVVLMLVLMIVLMLMFYFLLISICKFVNQFVSSALFIVSLFGLAFVFDLFLPVLVIVFLQRWCTICALIN